MKNTFKIVGLYVLGALCIVFSLYLDNSDELNVFLRKADDFRAHWGFGLYALIGLIKLVSLVAGVSIIIALTVLLVRKQIKKTPYNNI